MLHVYMLTISDYQFVIEVVAGAIQQPTKEQRAG